MKKLSFLFFTPLIFSCGGQSREDTTSDNLSENLTYTVDTALINAGEELVDLSGDMSVSDFFTDKRLLYLIGLNNKTLYIFDLEQRKLSRTIQFEKEGPNAVGEYASSLQVFEGTRDFLVYDVAKAKGKELDIPAMDLAGDFRVVLRSKEMVAVEKVNFCWVNDRLFVYSNATSEAYSHDYTRDRLLLHTFPHKVVALKKTGQVQNTVESEPAFQTEMKKISTQITFGSLIWDPARERYFRFEKIFIPRPDLERKGDDQVYLFAYDKDLNLTGEISLKS